MVAKKETNQITNTKIVWTGLVAGAMAGAIAKTTIAPLDRTKIYFQTHKEPYSVTKAIKFLKNTVRSEGILGLWRGNSATMARIVPHAAIQFSSHEQWKRVLGIKEVKTDKERRVKLFVAGSLAGVTSQSLTYPLDLARARMAVTEKHTYKSLREVFKRMWQQETLSAFYRGYVPTLLGVIPYAGFSFFIYDSLKYHYQEYSTSQGIDPSPFANLLFGAMAGAVGQTSSYPLDIVRRRMQTAQVTGEIYDSILGTLRKIYREEGVKAFFKGLSMNWVKGPVAVGISFATNEFLRDNLRRYF